MTTKAFATTPDGRAKAIERGLRRVGVESHVAGRTQERDLRRLPVKRIGFGDRAGIHDRREHGHVGIPKRVAQFMCPEGTSPGRAGSIKVPVQHDGAPDDGAVGPELPA